jgi:hypothetical protein
MQYYLKGELFYSEYCGNFLNSIQQQPISNLLFIEINFYEWQAWVNQKIKRRL